MIEQEHIGKLEEKVRCIQKFFGWRIQTAMHLFEVQRIHLLYRLIKISGVVDENVDFTAFQCSS